MRAAHTALAMMLGLTSRAEAASNGPDSTESSAARPIGALQGGAVQSAHVAIGAEVGALVAFPITDAVRVGGTVGWFRLAETTADYGDSASGVSAALSTEAHLLRSWFDPYFGVDLGIVIGSRTDGYDDSTITRVAPELGASIGNDFHIGPVVLGLAWHGRQALVPEAAPVPFRASFIPWVRLGWTL